MSYGYMPSCCSVYTDADLARIESDKNADKIKSLEKEVETLKRKLDSVLAKEPRRGKWKLLPSELVSSDGLWGETRYACSNCGYERHVKYRFCPNCGARMERSEE